MPDEERRTVEDRPISANERQELEQLRRDVGQLRQQAQFNPAAGAPPMLPDYEVVHDSVGLLMKGAIVPHGTYSEEQLARLTELGAVKPVAPAMVSPQQAQEAVESVATDTGEFKAREEEAARAAVVQPGFTTAATTEATATGTTTTTTGGRDLLDDIDLNDEQRQALRDRSLNTREAIAMASDEHLLGVPGVGPQSMRKLREGADRK